MESEIRMGRTMSRLPPALLCLVFLSQAVPYAWAQQSVGMTLVQSAAASEAFCLDGSLPAYHLDRGSGPGADNWVLQFEGGGWCNDLKTCLERAPTQRGSTNYVKTAVFSGILSNDPAQNPDFFNWNRVKLRYCDGASFTGDAIHQEGSQVLHFRGMKIWHAILQELLPLGLGTAKKALLTGCSAGGLSTILHCDNFTQYLPPGADVKCLSDAGFFMDGMDVSGIYRMRTVYNGVMTLQGAGQTVGQNCSSTPENLTQCFFPQYLLPNIRTPLFILNSAYDVFQFHHILAPPSADMPGHWKRCRDDPVACDPSQIEALQGFRNKMIAALEPLQNNPSGGMFINSCFSHCQSASQDTWLAPDSPKINNKSIQQAVGDWFFNRTVTKEIDCPYPCDKTCHNLIPGPSDAVS